MKISVALAEDGKGEVRFLGDIEHTPGAVRRLVTKLAGAGCCSVMIVEPAYHAIAFGEASPL
ncbi:MAG: hypothetical protein ACJ8CS_20380 [Microvirga sp.]